MRIVLPSRVVTIDQFTRRVAVSERAGGREATRTLPTTLDLPDIPAYTRYVQQHNILSNVYYNIARRCNLACPYCYSNRGNAAVSDGVNLTIVGALVEMKARAVTLIGGEPFSHPHLREIVTTLIESPIPEVVIVTNGTMVHDRHLAFLRHPKIAMQFSLDGIDEDSNAPTRGAGSYARTLRGLALAVNAGIPVRAMQVLTRNTVESAPDFFDKFQALGYNPGFFMVKQVPDDEKPSVQQIERLLEYVWNACGKDVLAVFDVVKFADNMQFETTGFPIAHCGAGISTISVDPDGRVYPCVKRSEPRDRMGSLLSKEGREALVSARNGILARELVFSKAQCSDCELSTICGGGCRAEETGEGVCEYNCGYFRLAVDFYARHV